jgi:uncharacterized protein (TIGR03083 family)
MSEEFLRIKRRLSENGHKTLTYFETLEPEHWQQQVYTTGSCWSVRHVLAHFACTERALVRLMQDSLGGGSGVPADFDIDAFNEREVAAREERPREQLIEDFRQARAASVSFVEGLSPEDLPRRAGHPWFGEMQVRDMLKLMYRHNMIHLRDVRKALETAQPVAHKQVDPPSRED